MHMELVLGALLTSEVVVMSAVEVVVVMSAADMLQLLCEFL